MVAGAPRYGSFLDVSNHGSERARERVSVWPMHLLTDWLTVDIRGLTIARPYRSSRVNLIGVGAHLGAHSESTCGQDKHSCGLQVYM